jgi:hypothetical protein
MSFVLAHHGIVDTALFVVPAVLALIALRWAEKRARARADRDASRGNGVD